MKAKNISFMKKVFVSLFLMFFAGNVFSQRDTIIYYSRHEKLMLQKSGATRYDKIMKEKDGTYTIKTYGINQGSWREVNKQTIQQVNDSTYWLLHTWKNKTDTTIRIFSKADSGFLIKEYNNGKLRLTGISSMIFPVIRESKWISYYANGLIASESYYKNNQLLKNRNWNESGEEGISDVFTFSDTMPEFKGGEAAMFKFLANETKYPAEAAKINMQGRVIVQFIVMEDGRVDGVKILRGICSSLDSESIRVVKSMSGKWNPGTIDGKRVRVYFVLPLVYSLKE